MSKEIQVPCIVEKVTYRKDCGFALLACTVNEYSDYCNQDIKSKIQECINPKYNTFTVSFSSLDVGINPENQAYIFIGNFKNHPKFGKQFEANYGFLETPSSVSGFKSFLMTLPHIKSQRSEFILKKWSVEKIKDILTNSPSELCLIPGITEQRVRDIKSGWDVHNAKMGTYSLISSAGFGAKVAEKAFKVWGIQAPKILSESPYTLCQLPRISFPDADIFANRIYKSKGMSISQKERTHACLRYILWRAYYEDAQVCLPYHICKQKLVEAISEANRRIGEESSEKDQLLALSEILRNPDGTFSVVKNLSREGEPIYIYLSSVWSKEVFISNGISRLYQSRSNFLASDSDISSSENDIRQFYGRNFSLDEQQKNAIKSAFNNKVTLITGGGGTGKTTICKCIYQICKKKGMSIKMMSPTGRASQVLSEKTGCDASTIHRSLGLLPGEDEPKHQITSDLVLIDEISMCGIDTFYAVMSAIETNPRCNLILVGDKNQLPSVAPGNILFDIIESGAVNVVTLDKIHRQDENSYISILANKIAKGENIEIPKDAKDISWKDINTDEVEYTVDRMISKYLEKNNIEDLQVISPMKKGICGVYSLCSMIQKKMKRVNNVAEAESIERGFDKYYLMDRVIQTENNYEKDVFNGDMGVIVELGVKTKDDDDDDKKHQYVIVDFYGKKRVTYYGDEIDEIQLGWAITIHKFQGSQSKFIILFLSSEAMVMMSKELVYTAFTRAEKKLVILGHKKCLPYAANNSSIKTRYTNMESIIDGLINKKENFKVIEK